MIDVLLPTLGRPHALAPLIESFASATTLPYRIIFVADHADEKTQAELDRLDAEYILEDGTYPHKTNAAYLHGSGDLVLPTADDVVPHPGWAEAVVNALRNDSVMVVGTDDLSPATVDRTHATMPVIRRSYCEDPGASWREPGRVFHEGFHHLWCETEICGLSQHRGVWTFAEQAVIEHRHPDWGSRERDATDRKGNGSNNDADKALFQSRRRRWGQ